MRSSKMNRILEEELERCGLSDRRIRKIQRRLSEDVKDADRKDAGDIDILEDIDVDTMLTSTSDTAIGAVPVDAGEYVIIDEIDYDANTAHITIYDVDGNMRDDGVEVDLNDLKVFADASEPSSVEDVENTEEDGEETVEESAKRKRSRKSRDDELEDGEEEEVAERGKRSRKSRKGRDDDLEDDEELGVTERAWRRRAHRRRDDDFEDEEPGVVERARRRLRSRRDEEDLEDEDDEAAIEEAKRRYRRYRRVRDKGDGAEEQEVTERARRRRRRGDGCENCDDEEVAERARRRRYHRGRDEDFEDEDNEAAIEESEVTERTRRGRKSRGDGCENCEDEKVTESFRRKMRAFARKRNADCKKSATLSADFDLKADTMTFACEAGDVMDFNTITNTVSITRRGRTVVSDLKVSKGLYQRCQEAGVFSGSSVNEGKHSGSQMDVRGAVLTYKVNKGYTFIKEGVETGLGNRIRARAWLSSKGYNCSGDQLDKAYEGKLVTL